MPVAIFCMFFTSQEINIKWSPNTAKLAGGFLWTRTPKMGQSSTWGCPEGGTTYQGAPTWVVLPSENPSGTSLAQQVSSSPEKISKNFRCVWTSFGIDFL